ncbi:MAG: glucose-1-phosphate adenylyltransferase [Chloroflexi bacterium]|nr:glucose-1-phosphate adenylyltransferase [Chloroflexota bacterium]
MSKILAIILAGGQGERMSILTLVRAKPAVTFAAKYRMIDFTLSNCVNSGIYRVAVITQYRPRSLNDHLGIGRPWDLDRQEGGLRLFQPYTGRPGSDRYLGTADAVYQNLYYVQEQKVDQVLVLAGDHVYKQDYNALVETHAHHNADVTVAVTQVPIFEASRFGIMTVDNDGRVVGFTEKPPQPKSNLVSMGIYLFNKEPLIHCLMEDAADPNSPHDFGRSVLPRMIGHHRVFAHPFSGYWRDVGTVQAYWETHMDLLKDPPPVDFYDNWVIHTRSEERAPARLCGNASVEESLVSHGCIIEGRVERSVLSPGVRVAPGAVVRESIVMVDGYIGPNAVVDHAILDKRVVVAEGCKVGWGEDFTPNQEEPALLESGITLVGKGAQLPPGARIGRNCKVFPYTTEADFTSLDVPSGQSVHRKSAPTPFMV